ncbi:MAG: deoxyuridine 5'-triphosphate nucleotidohydrolase [Candidatus Zambryskibacteria bacterium RIFCSPLOWO2_02_FULL_39_69]|nr:MAG: deoxyuridine 5'-triphosphate nucleotidohydrolase [Candidatus Zambryskibacteria bacterium RIFCSPLOWO2_02_39_10]OHB10279.1 MAG: deoxyuridine 5'-triphosphate nucleotidohydrolase [Candidatus Zambryskibacteria bacterium RIFCSPLOWO2_02_FULL_39_69]
MILKVKKLSLDAILPTYARSGDAGMDLYVNETVTLLPGKTIKLHSGIAVEIPEGFVGLCWDKSGLSINYGIKVLGGVIDSGFRGEIMLGVINLGSKPYTFEKGHKIMQMVVQPVEKMEIIESDILSDSDRGHGGLGSTGK